MLSASVPSISFAQGSTSGTTALVQDIVPGIGSSSPNSLVNAGGRLFFLANDSNGGMSDLWSSDGSSSGTIQVTSGLTAALPVALGNSVVFLAQGNATGQDSIDVTDTSAAGYHQVAALPGSIAEYSAAVGKTAYFEIQDNASGNFELWKSDGTSSGTAFVSAIPYASDLTASGGKLFFTANDPVAGSALWVSDGTATGTALVEDIRTGVDAADPQDLTDVGGTLYFLANDGSAGVDQLWASNGTASGTQKIDPAVEPQSLVNLGGKVLFTGQDIASGQLGVWTSTGTTAGTSLVATLPPGSLRQLAVAGNTAFFGLYPPGAGSFSLWKTDGTTAGTVAVDTALTNGNQFTASGGSLFFTSDDPVNGNELFTSDGTASGTHLVSDIDPGSIGSYPGNLTDVGGVLFFDANDGSHGDELWKSQPPTQAVTTIKKGGVFTAPGTFSDAATDAPWTATVNYGDGTGVQPLSLGANQTFALSHQYLLSGVFPVTVSVTGADGLAGSASIPVTVQDVAPTASIVGAVSSVPEGTPINLGSTVADPTGVNSPGQILESWAVAKDGQPFRSGTGPALAFTPMDDGSYLVTLTATDPNGGASTQVSQAIAVTEVTPVLTIVGAPATVAKGQPISLSSTVVDPNPPAISESWTVTDNGATVASGQGATLGFTPTQAGTYVVTLAGTEGDGTSSLPVSSTIVVLDASLKVAIGGTPNTSPEGTAIHLSSLLTGDPTGVSYAWSATYSGKVYASGQGPGFQFVPQVGGTYVVTLSASNASGGSATASANVSVTAVAPTVTLVGDGFGVSGQARTLTLSAVVPSTVDMAQGFTYLINWGDGSPAQTVLPGQPTSVGHVYTGTGIYTVKVSASDAEGVTGAPASWKILIASAALEPDPTNPSKSALVVGGSTGNDQIWFSPARDPGGVLVSMNGSSLGEFHPTGTLIAFGQSGNDLIAASRTLTNPTIFHAGSGNSILVAGGGDSILVGGGGSDLLIGGPGRNLLIAGSGSSILVSGGNDILVAGSTAYDHNDAALAAILGQWESGSTLAQRVANLTRGITQGGSLVKLDATTVTPSTSADLLVVLNGPVWGLVNTSLDPVLGKKPGSIFTAPGNNRVPT